MTDKSWVVVCVVAGLGIAYVASNPLRHPSVERVGTPLSMGGPTMGVNTANIVEAKKSGKDIYAEGQILIDDSLAKKLSQFSTLFILAKAPGMKGAPIAVQKIDQPQFPLSFSLSQVDSPFDGEFYDGDVVVTARLDQDGSAGPKQDGDVDASVEIKKGVSRQIQLMLK